MAYNEFENRIVELAAENPIDINKVQECFDHGANPNAIDYWNESDQEYYDTLFTDCFTLFDAPDLYPLLECFLKNGLDVKKYGERIISDLIYLADNDRFKMIQLIFDCLPEKISIQKALKSIGEEASFYNCNPEFYKGKKTPEWESNELDGLYEMIDAYENDERYDRFKQLPEVINQKLVSITVSGDWILADEEKMVYRYKDNTLFMIIEMEQDILIIKNGFMAFVNNACNLEKQKNAFTICAEKCLADETVKRVSLYPYSINVSDKHPQNGRNMFLDGRTVTIEFSGEKKIVFTTDIDTDNDTVFIQT